MQYCCYACLQQLPPSSSEQESRSIHNLQYNEVLAKAYCKITGIVINSVEEYPKQLCEVCYNKIRAFDDFCETALDCSTALCELLLEEDFSLRTLKNLKYFCSTCLSQMEYEPNDSLHINNIQVQCWLDKCNKLKKQTGVEYWPKSICKRCCKKIDDFLKVQHTAIQAFKLLNKTKNPQGKNIEYIYQEEKHKNVVYTEPLVESAQNSQLSNQKVKRLEETIVSTSYNVANEVNLAKTFSDEQKNDTSESFILDHKNNNQVSSKQVTKQSFEKDLEVLKQHSSTQYYLTQPYIKPKTKTNIKRNPLTQSSPIKSFPCNQCPKVFKNKARLKRHKRYSLSCSKK